VIDYPPAWADGPDEYLQKGLAVHDEWKGDPLVGMVFAPHAPYTVADGVLERVRVLAHELDLPVHMHLHETASEVEEALAAHGERPLARLDRLGLINPAFAAVHMTQVDDADLATLARTGAAVIHCPESNLKLASGFCPVAKLAATGVDVALGTDGAASNNDLDMLDEARTAALVAKAVSGDASALSAHRALHMATLAGAQALGLAGETGSLVPGKAADFAAFDLDQLGTTPVYEPVHTLVYSASSRQATDVWVAGRRVVRHGEVVTLDVSDARARAADWAERVREAAA
jgi:5-methylthioadenosine/S-adenosylhomocysteine deaminase